MAGRVLSHPERSVATNRQVRDARTSRSWRFLLGALLSGAILVLAAAPSASAMSIGLMSGGPYWESKSEWDSIQHSGAAVFRAGISAHQYENSGDWEKIKNMFRWTAERGIVILPYLYGRPVNGSELLPSETEWKGSKWNNFISGVVKTFGHNGSFWAENPQLPYHPVGAWEVWNEPNLAMNNPGGVVDPVHYGKFLKYTSAKIHGAQAEISGNPIQVLFGGLYTSSYGGGMPIGEYLQKVKAVSEIGAWFDGLGVHTYSFAAGLYGLQTIVTNARDQLSTHFSSSKPLWITEIGWHVSGGDKNSPAVTPEQQAICLKESFNWLRSMSSNYNIPLAVWYFYRDAPNNPNWDAHTGLRDEFGGFRPAWYEFQEQNNVVKVPYPDSNPYSWHTENLGGVNTSNADMSSAGPGDLKVFVRGSDNGLWYRDLNGFRWTGWTSLGGKLAGGPGAVNQGPNETNVMATGYSDGWIWHWFQVGGQWYSGQNFGGANTSDPDVSSWGPGRLDFFVRGSDNALWHRYWNGVVWSPWESLGGNLTSSPGAVSWGPNRIDVVARGADGKTIEKWWYDGTWHCCENLGGVNTSAPDIASTGSGRLEMVVRGSDNALWLRQYISGSGWGGWQSLGGNLIHGPGAVSWGKNYRLDIVAPTSGGQLTHWWWGPEG